MKNDYSTIEHDYLHIKDCFSSYKFTYKEKKSKLYFLQNINDPSVQDTAPLLDISKKQLENVKSVYTAVDEEIKSYSTLIYEEDLSLKANQELLDSLTEEEYKLEKELASYQELCDKVELNEKLNNKLDQIEAEITQVFSNSEILKTEISKNEDLLISEHEEINRLKDLRSELAIKQKRLTIINIDNYIEDIYSWFQQVSEIYGKIFGNLEFYSQGDNYFIKVQNEAKFIEVVLKDKKIVDVHFSTGLNDEAFEELERLKVYAINTNDVRLLLLELSNL